MADGAERGSATRLAESDLLAGRYAYEGELGQGSSGRVLRVLDRVSGERRALKVVGERDAGHLRWEFRILVGIAHPNVAAVYELLRLERAVSGPFRLAPGTTVLVEQLAEGRGAHVVADELRHEPQALLAWVLLVGEALARALSAIHAAGLIHGDVKPQNAVVSEDGTDVKLVDLGLARSPRAEHVIRGTPAYLAPEAWQGEQSVASDVYGLGATLHDLLGGASPLADTRSRSAAEIAAVALRHPRRAEALPPFVPPALRRLLGTMLADDPATRPASSREAAARLAAAASELGHAVGQGVLGGGAEEAATPAERALALSVLPLVGREPELRDLSQALARGGVVWVHGPPGGGRTRLVREAARRVQAARAAAGEAVPTYAYLCGAMPEHLPGHAAILHIEQADTVDLADADAAMQAAQLLGRSLCLVLEGTLPSEGGANTACGPIGRAEVERLLASAGDGRAPSPRLVEAALRASGGLPGRLCRLLAEGLRAGLDPFRPQTLEELGAGGGDALPLTGRSLAVAELLAVAGGALSADAMLAAAIDGGPEAFDALVAGGMASVDVDGRLRLRSDVVRTLLGRMSPERRAGAARMLVPDTLDPEGRAFAAASLDSAGARGLLLAAAQRRRRAGDPEGASALVQTAALLLGAGGLGAELSCARADALRARGRYRDAIDALAASDTPAATILRADILRLLGDVDGSARALTSCASLGDPARLAADAVAARLALDAGRLEDAHGLAASVVARAADEEQDAIAAGRASEVLALVALRRGDLPGAADRVGQALGFARRAGDPYLEARAHSVAASVALARGEVHGAARRQARAFDLADRAGELHAAATFLVNLGLTRLDAGEPGPAIAALRDGARRLARLGRDADLARALYNLGLAAVLVGDDDLGVTALRTSRSAAARCKDISVLAFASVVEAEIALRAGHLNEAQTIVESAWAVASGAVPADRAVVAARRAVILASAADATSARGALEDARAGATGVASDAVAVELEIAEARVALADGDGPAAHAAATRARAAAERAGTYEARLRSLLIAADAAEMAGEREVARRCLSDARTLLDTAANTLEPSARARLRSVAAYQRALVSVPSEDARERDDRWRRLALYARRLTATRRVPRLQEEILDAAVELSGAERGFLVLRDSDGRLSVPIARDVTRMVRRTSLEDEGVDDLRFSRSIAARAIDGGRSVTTLDALHDERLDGAASVHALSLRSVMAVPLRRRDGIVGAIYLDDRLRPGAFGPDDVALLEDLADLAGVALDGAELLRAERRNARRLAVMRRRLARTVESQALELQTLKRASADAGSGLAGMVARSEPMRRVLSIVERVAPADVPVLIMGESGTGKELVARALHRGSPRSERPFVGENCGAIPEPLLESALFGHVRGAFTGADRSRMGIFEAADTGTLFLDEIGEMSPAMQAKLLRALQDGDIRPVGSDTTRRVDVRIVTATHRDLERMVRDGTFREDLYYRLAVVSVQLPPLRERPDDIPPLVAHLAAKHGAGRRVRVEPAAMARLCAFAWPGNVRQLENEVQRALVLSPDVIGADDLSPAVRGDAEAELPGELDLKGQVGLLERRLIRSALSRSGNNQTRAAQFLGISRYGLSKMMKRLGL